MAIKPRQHKQGEGRLEAAEARRTFLGTLRSELDSAVKLDPRLETLSESFYEAHERYERGEIDDSELGQILQDLIFTDDVGVEWTIGATTMRWYRRAPGGRWGPAPADLAVINTP